MCEENRISALIRVLYRLLLLITKSMVVVEASSGVLNCLRGMHILKH